MDPGFNDFFERKGKSRQSSREMYRYLVSNPAHNTTNYTTCNNCTFRAHKDLTYRMDVFSVGESFVGSG